MVSLEVTLVLLVVKWVHLSSTLSDACLSDLDEGQGTLLIKCSQ